MGCGGMGSSGTPQFILLRVPHAYEREEEQQLNIVSIELVSSLNSGTSGYGEVRVGTCVWALE